MSIPFLLVFFVPHWQGYTVTWSLPTQTNCHVEWWCHNPTWQCNAAYFSANSRNYPNDQVESLDPLPHRALICIFLKVKENLSGKKFSSGGDSETAAENWVNWQGHEFKTAELKKLVLRSNNCLNKFKYYVENWLESMLRNFIF